MSGRGARLVVVGGGILGTMHALEGVRRGFSVVHLERSGAPRGASVRNFGLVWVGGRAPGTELELAVRSRELWEEVARVVPGTGFRAAGSLTVARSVPELAVLEEVAARPDASLRGLELLTPERAREIVPGLAPGVVGALLCTMDAVVEPRDVLGAVRAVLGSLGGYRYVAGREVVAAGAHAVVDHLEERHEGDLVVLCPGASPGALALGHLTGAPVRRVRLQMLETAPFAGALTPALADGDSLRYYPAYAGRALGELPPQGETAARWRSQLLCVRRATGHLTIGDTHAYAEPFPFDLADDPMDDLLRTAAGILDGPLPPVERRWAGVYAETTDASLYHRAEVAPGVFLVTGAGGRGMTLAPAIAAETFE